MDAELKEFLPDVLADVVAGSMATPFDACVKEIEERARRRNDPRLLPSPSSEWLDVTMSQVMLATHFMSGAQLLITDHVSANFRQYRAWYLTRWDDPRELHSLAHPATWVGGFLRGQMPPPHLVERFGVPVPV